MNRYERQLSRAFEAVNAMQDEHRIVKHELRDTLAENRRLRYMMYGPERREFADAMVRAEERAVDRRRPVINVDTYFDVGAWCWVAFADIKVRI